MEVITLWLTKLSPVIILALARSLKLEPHKVLKQRVHMKTHSRLVVRLPEGRKYSKVQLNKGHAIFTGGTPFT